ncbi:MAG: hypothetical protein H7A43_05540 [Verrucomicrobia bacterium]|nr:hypothetical protein [Kiritimatiellia bacterium]MCP5488093.1 hypothetical protein [Verrucomicrobiota bacterium]
MIHPALRSSLLCALLATCVLPALHSRADDPANSIRMVGELAFPPVLEGQNWLQNLILHNDGTGPVTVTNFAWPTGFSGGWTGTISSSESRIVPVTFAPSTTGDFGGTLLVQYDATTSTTSRTVSGTGTPRPTFSITNPAAPLSVGFFTTSLVIEGTASTSLVGRIRWTNDLTGTSGDTPAQSAWQTTVPLGIGTNHITAIATNLPDFDYIASDKATDAVYADGWQSGDNGGSGFDEWMLISNGVNAGHTIVSNTFFNNLDSVQKAWTLWAHSGSEANAYRAFPRPLRSGDTVQVMFENSWIDTGGAVGVALENPDGESLLEFYFQAGSLNYTIRDATGIRDSGIEGTGSGFPLSMTRTDGNGYELEARGTTITGSLIARTDMSAVRFRAWNHSAGLGDNYQFYLSNLSVTQSPPVYATSDTVTVIRDLGIPPIITLQPDGFAGNYARTGSLELTVTGAPPFSYQWRKDGVPLAGATNATLDFSYLLLSDAGSYDAVITNIYGGVTSLTASVTVDRTEPIILWTNPAPISYGTPLGATQLNAEAETGGYYEYIPEAGVILNAGTYPLTAQFVPNDTGNWVTIYVGATLVVERASQTIDFPNPGPQLVDSIITLSVTADSGLPVVIEVLSGPAEYDEPNLICTSPGEVIVSASQAGNSNWLQAATVQHAFLVQTYIDSNTNGLPDDYETNTFGSLEVSTGISDNDGDRATDFEEYIAGTDPTDEAEYLFIAQKSPGDPVRLFMLEWPSTEGRLYSVYRATNPSGPYLPVEEDLEADPPFNLFWDNAPTPPTDVFYQIRVRIAP